MNLGTLTIVATPIGNLQDISLRAIKTLLTANVIACEDTRRTGLLLQEIKKLVPAFVEEKKPKLISFYDQVEMEKIPEILSLLLQGLTVAVVSDAGTPLVSDPGFKLVRECVKQGIRVESIPGPSSVITALTISGLPTDKFLFLGFLPKKQGHRKKLLEDVKRLSIQTTVIFFEAPHRIKETLEEFAKLFGEDQYMVIARELTKLHEEVLRDTIVNLQKHFSKVQAKGEFVILLHLEK